MAAPAKSKQRLMTGFCVITPKRGSANISHNLPETPSTSPETETKKSHENCFTGMKPGKCKEDPDIMREAHDESHNFRYCYGTQRHTVSCGFYGTVEDSLKTSDNFKNAVEKNKDKEMVILRGKSPMAAVCSHFPCHLIDNDELLKISFIKGEQQGSEPLRHSKKKSNKKEVQPSQLITFYVQTTGGNNIQTKVIKNQELRKKLNYLCVYAYKNEKVKQALRRDGRFHKLIFSTRCVLLESMPEEVRTELSQLAEGLDGKMVQVIRVGSAAQPVPDSLEDTPIEETCDPPVEQPEAEPSTQDTATPETGNTHSQGKEAKKDGRVLSVKKKMQVILNSEEILKILRSQYADLVNTLKKRENLKRPSDVQQFFREEFGKKTQCFQEVKIMESLMELSASVCQVRIQGNPKGTGFLLFDKFVLTNAHVIETIYVPITNKLQQTVTVTFDFKDLTGCNEMPIKPEVVVYKKKRSDFALLELAPTGTNVKLPASLLPCFSFPTVEGGICLLGHPDGGVKKHDISSIIAYEGRSKAINKHREENPDFLQVINQHSFDVKYEPNVLTYDTCFFYGSSGSPAFNEHCQVVAMHTGGYPYKDKTGKPQSVIEYGIPLYSILEDVIIQAVQRKRIDVLEGFLVHKCQNEKLDVVLDRVKERSQNASLVEAFQEKLPPNRLIPEEQRTFYQFLFENVPEVELMDMDSVDSK
ncbi:hypothetical protein DPEC_G00054190 [Dallia pectoralis]|uniref:Uncharacterized protein n=1 Tax=Dallia pectoralis TaxID=75939 RepID=A0ACC2H4Z9_DALPE|nr:hypothetical protein DPEC_G00054190 [Dallia pectoralis]